MRISYWSSDVCSSDLAMSYRDIMVHLTLDPRNAERTRFAIGLARRFNARISGLYTVPPPNVPYYVGEYITTELLQRWEERRVGKECVGKFRSRGAPCE